MKIKILEYVPRSITGMMVDLQPGEIIAVDESIALNLEAKGKAEILID